jgi:thiol-disulfide isomerase/thioredoxin
MPCVLHAMLSLWVAALIAPVASGAPDPAEILEEAPRALASTGDITYRFVYTGHGSLAGHFSGRVKLKKGKAPGRGAMWVSMQVPERHGSTENPRTLRIATRGSGIRVLDERRRTVSHGTLTGGSGHLLTYAYYGVLFQFVRLQPFAAELGDSLIAYVGVDTVNGVPCDVVQAANNSFGGADVHWIIGRDDRLPHAQHWDVTTPGVTGGFQFEIDSLVSNAELSDADFDIGTPAGYVEVDEDARNVGIGRPAPDWTLRTHDGKAVHLADLRGEVVVLDFWASWCPPCWKLMPEFDSVAKEFEGRGVRFFGVNAWESPSVDPAAYEAERSIGYPVLIEGETIAADYKIGSLPAVFVIDRAGRIAYLNNPVARSPSVVGGELRQAITQALP